MWRDSAKTSHRDTFLGLAIRTARAPLVLNVRPGSLIKYAFVTDEGAIEHKENTLNLLATMTLPVSFHADHVLKPPQNPIPHPNEAIFKDWYTFPDAPPLYSRDWANWDGTEMRLPFLNSTLHGVEASINIPYRLPAPIEPFIFCDPEECGLFDSFAFRCDGAYYFYDYERQTVQRCHGTYESPAAFLRAELEPFSVYATQNPRMEELVALRMKLFEVFKSSPPGAGPLDEWSALHEEKKVVFRNPPPNEIYTEIFPWED
ncbi:hypothetical protein DFH08DRAFT_810384 [Mycena albidolilacea]|uniref:Uncharacterized protein n=1 Tax=Mycena albidolilacea TaxID=1033008 RepID=A0AAD6ZY66_9AGAR|nr:hypothetical protein DFH08DRAFT_810384 [Mycena albidolilacea]